MEIACFLTHFVSICALVCEVSSAVISWAWFCALTGRFFTGFHQFAEFTAEDVGTVDSGLNAMVLANNNEMVLLPVNEPTFGTKRKSQIQTYLEQNGRVGGPHPPQGFRRPASASVASFPPSHHDRTQYISLKFTPSRASISPRERLYSQPLRGVLA